MGGKQKAGQARSEFPSETKTAGIISRPFTRNLSPFHTDGVDPKPQHHFRPAATMRSTFQRHRLKEPSTICSRFVTCTISHHAQVRYIYTGPYNQSIRSRLHLDNAVLFFSYSSLSQDARSNIRQGPLCRTRLYAVPRPHCPRTCSIVTQ